MRVFPLALTLSLALTHLRTVHGSNMIPIHPNQQPTRYADEEPSTSPPQPTPPADVSTGSTTAMPRDEVPYAESSLQSEETTPSPQDEAAWWEWYKDPVEPATIIAAVTVPSRVARDGMRIRRCETEVVVTTYDSFELLCWYFSTSLQRVTGNSK